jgi:YegS/Rv2252/BmrU family lipid kinase
MNAVVVINPVAGGRARVAPGRRAAIARAALARAGVPGRVVLTERAGHARELARAAVDAGDDLVIAWGGDGTINEVACALVATPTALGVVRAGSGNGFARELGIPRRPDLALAAALAGEERVIDTGEIDGRIFLNIAGIGFDASMAMCFNDLGGERRGSLRYTASVIRSVFAYRPVRYTIDADGQRMDANALLLAIANLPQYGSNAVIAPQAVPTDGLLDLVVIEDRGAWGRVGLVPRLFDRSIQKAPGVAFRPAKRFVVSAAEPMMYHVDGEPIAGGTRLEARIVPRSLRLRGADTERWRRFIRACPAGILDT